MGLDMYIGKRVHKYTNAEKMPNFDKYGRSDAYDVTSTVAYWRKANAIHNYFVTKFADGDDNCHPIGISINEIRDLRDLCENVMTKMFCGKRAIEHKGEDEKDKDVKEFVITMDWLKDNFDDLYSYDFVDPLTDTEIEDLKSSTIAPVGGFFFGSTDFDFGYVYMIVKTYLMLSDVIDSHNDDEYPSYTYQASW